MAEMGRPSIYGLYDKDGALRYIGKANCVAKRLKSHMRDSSRRNTPLYAWIRENGQPEIRVIEADCEDWKESERRLIAEARASGVILLNIADGGDQPFCPKEVLAENGRKAAAKRNPVIYGLLRKFGQDAIFFKKHGLLRLIPKLEHCQAVLRRMTKEKQAAFAAEWIRRGRYSYNES